MRFDGKSKTRRLLVLLPVARPVGKKTLAAKLQPDRTFCHRAIHKLRPAQRLPCHHRRHRQLHHHLHQFLSHLQKILRRRLRHLHRFLRLFRQIRRLHPLPVLRMVVISQKGARSRNLLRRFLKMEMYQGTLQNIPLMRLVIIWFPIMRRR